MGQNMCNDLFRVKFEQRFRVTPGCWPWTAGMDSHGYGKISWQGKSTRAHRASYELYVQPIPPGMHVLHSCDNPSCVNPAHLRAGTHAENMADKTSKGRAIGAAQGQECHNAILTTVQVKAIFNDPRPNKTIAAEYSVASTTIGDIKNGRTWAHLFKGEKRSNKCSSSERLRFIERIALLESEVRRLRELQSRNGA
jgi:hypothetical protein